MPYHHGALRTALLEAAEAILEQDGRQKLTLRAVARRVGVSHAAPTPHFGDLKGLLTALAASGFIRLRQHCEAALQAVTCNKSEARLMALAYSYVAFARAHPGLFRLMLGSERLDWGSPDLAVSGGAAFALLTNDDLGPHALPTTLDFDTLVVAMTRLSLMHGLAMLLVDGRIEPFVARTQSGSLDVLIQLVLGAAAV